MEDFYLKTKKLSFLIIILLLISSMGTVTYAKGNPLSALKSQVSSLRKQVNSLTTKVNSYAYSNKKLTESLKKEIVTTAKLNSKSKQLEKSVAEQRKTLSAKDAAITELKNKLAGVSSNYENEKNANSQKDIIISSYEQDVKQKNDTISKIMNIESIVYTDSNGQTVQPNAPGSIKWLGFSTAHLDFYLTPKALTEFSYILNHAENIYSQIGDFYKISGYPNRTKIYIFFDEDITITRVGEYFAGNNTIFIKGSMMAPYNIYNQANLIGCFTHELTHAFEMNPMGLQAFRNRTSNDIFWLTEGTADYVDHNVAKYPTDIPKNQLTQKSNFPKDYYPSLIKENLYLNKISLNDFNRLPDQYLKFGYITYESIIYFLEHQYGHEAFLQYHKYLSTMSEDEACKLAFGRANEDIVKEWKLYYGLN